jgi:hypothetical protein
MIFEKFLHLNITIGCMLCAGFVKAQMPNYMPAVNRQFMNTQFNNFMMSSMNHAYRPTTVQKHSFKVVFTDSSTITVFGKIKSDSSLQYLLWEDKSVKRKDDARFKKIYPAQTQYIIRADNGSSEYTGNASDSCWLFKAIEGKITGYSPVADGELTTAFIWYIQKDNGTLVEMNKDNLESMVKDNEKALELFEKKKYEKAIRKYNKENR